MKNMRFFVSVPVLSEKMYSICPSSALSDEEYTDIGPLPSVAISMSHPMKRACIKIASSSVTMRERGMKELSSTMYVKNVVRSRHMLSTAPR